MATSIQLSIADHTCGAVQSGATDVITCHVCYGNIPACLRHQLCRKALNQCRRCQDCASLVSLWMILILRPAHRPPPASCRVCQVVRPGEQGRRGLRRLVAVHHQTSAQPLPPGDRVQGEFVVRSRCMDGWMDGWMMAGWIDARMHTCTHVGKHGSCVVENMAICVTGGGLSACLVHSHATCLVYACVPRAMPCHVMARTDDMQVHPIIRV